MRIPKDAPHPGEILREEFLRPLNLTQQAFAEYIGVSFRRINEIVNGKRRLSPESAQLFAMALNTSVELWMNLQNIYDLAHHPVGYTVKPLQQTG